MALKSLSNMESYQKLWRLKKKISIRNHVLIVLSILELEPLSSFEMKICTVPIAPVSNPKGNQMHLSTEVQKP